VTAVAAPAVAANTISNSIAPYLEGRMSPARQSPKPALRAAADRK
jgi:hypothetical protein